MKRAWLPSSSIYQLLTIICICGVIASWAGRVPLAHGTAPQVHPTMGFWAAMMAGYRVLLGLKRAPGLLSRAPLQRLLPRRRYELKQRMTVGLQLVQDRHAGDEQNQKLQ